MSTMTCTLLDAKGQKSFVSYNILLDTTMNVANLQEVGERFVEDVDNITGCQILAATINYEVDFAQGPGNLKPAPLEDVDVEEGARFSFRTAAGFLTKIRIPGFLETLYEVGLPFVALANPLVAAFIASVVDGIGYGGLADDIDGTDNRGADIVAVDSAVQAHVRQRRYRP